MYNIFPIVPSLRVIPVKCLSKPSITDKEIIVPNIIQDNFIGCSPWYLRNFSLYLKRLFVRLFSVSSLLQDLQRV